MNKFYENLDDAWKSIFRLSDRTRYLEKVKRLQDLLNTFFFVTITGLIISQVVIYAHYFG